MSEQSGRVWEYLVVVTDLDVTDNACELYLTEDEYTQYMRAVSKGTYATSQWLRSFKLANPDSVVEYEDPTSTDLVVEPRSETEEGSVIARLFGDESEQTTEQAETTAEVKVENIERTEETSTIGVGLIGGFMLVILGFCLISTHLLRMLEKTTKESVDILMQHGVTNTNIENAKDVVQECNADSTPYKAFQRELRANIDKVRQIRGSVKDDAIAQALTKDIDLLEQIYDNVDATEFDKGNIAKLNDGATTGYIGSLLKLVSNYVKIATFKGLPTTKTKTTLRELREAILKSQEVFGKILVEALDKELLEASVESNLFVNVSVRNGVLADKNTLVLEK